jgi:hypothetical protein
MDDEDRRWPIKSLDASRSSESMKGKWQAQAKEAPHDWGFVDVDAPAPPLDPRWKNWLGKS